MNKREVEYEYGERCPGSGYQTHDFVRMFNNITAICDYCDKRFKVEAETDRLPLHRHDFL